MANINLAQASLIVDTAITRGRELGLLPLTVVVLDSGGNPVLLKREDNSGILRPQIANGKAWASLGMSIPSRTIRDNLADRPTFINSLAIASDGRFIPVPGGVLIKNKNGETLGAVGISGDTSEKDEYCAIEGVKASGLIPQPEEPVPGWEDSTLGGLK